MAEETKKWLNEAVEKLTGQKKTEDPLVSTADIEDRLTKLRQSYNIVRNTPKPKVTTLFLLLVINYPNRKNLKLTLSLMKSCSTFS